MHLKIILSIIDFLVPEKNNRAMDNGPLIRWFTYIYIYVIFYVYVHGDFSIPQFHYQNACHYVKFYFY